MRVLIFIIFFLNCKGLLSYKKIFNCLGSKQNFQLRNPFDASLNQGMLLNSYFRGYVMTITSISITGIHSKYWFLIPVLNEVLDLQNKSSIHDLIILVGLLKVLIPISIKMHLVHNDSLKVSCSPLTGIHSQLLVEMLVFSITSEITAKDVFSTILVLRKAEFWPPIGFCTESVV